MNTKIERPSAVVCPQIVYFVFQFVIRGKILTRCVGCERAETQGKWSWVKKNILLAYSKNKTGGEKKKINVCA